MATISACAIKPVIATKPKVVSVNGVEIARAAIASETQNHPATKPVEAWLSAARALVVRELLLQEARRLAIECEPITDEKGRREIDEEALVRAVIDREVTTPQPDEATCHRYYTHNPSRFRTSDLYEVSHILISAPTGDKAARCVAHQQAKALINDLSCSPEKFASLAKLHSACPSRDMDGNLGQIGPGQTVPEFERALSTMPIGSVHLSPIESRYGFHIVRVNRHHEGRLLPFELVSQRISDYLAERVRRTAIRQYISLLAGRAAITGIEIAGSPTPLVQ